jgi:hypothetical protein
MTIQGRLKQWDEQGAISAEQRAQLTSLAREEPLFLFIELNVLLYAGVLAFVAGLGWTVTTWSKQLGDVAIVSALSAILAVTLWCCFSRGPGWSQTETPASSPILDYVLYLGCLVWGIELTYLEQRFHLLSGQWDLYLLATAALFFFLAYRFDNRFVLSLALSSLAGWFGLSISHGALGGEAAYRWYALLYCLVVGVGGTLLRRLGLKARFFNTYLNVATTVLFWAVLSGVFEQEEYGSWFVALLIACVASLAWGLAQPQFAFVAYAAVYGYIGVSSLVVRNLSSSDESFILAYFVVTAIAMIAMLVAVARRFGRAE